MKGRCLNTGRTHFKKGVSNNALDKNPMWKGGRWTRKDGYVLVLKHGHPMARPSGYILEHRYLMSKHLRRTLDKNEIVHHINGIKNDNRIKNLKILSASKHTSLHCNKKLKWECVICSTTIKDSPSRTRKYCSRKCFYTGRGFKNYV